MAGVELGTAYLSLIASTRGLAASVRQGVALAEPEAERGGKKAGSKFGGAMKLAAVAGVAAAGAVVAKGFMDAIEREKLGDKTAAALGLSGKQAQKAGKVSADLYAGAWGGSMEEVNGAVESVMSSIKGMAKASPAELKAVTAAALDIATAFDVDVDQAATNAGILMKTGLAKNATEAMDLITVGLQSVPKSLRGEVMDATQEYSDMFAALGFTGKESIGLLVSASENGQYGIDKMGDAIKEFTIRGTDMSKTTKAAYETIGLNSRKTTNDLLAGGDKAQGAFQKIIDGVKGIKDPAKQSQAAIALFGTPLEDLGTKDIPKFLESLTGAGEGMGKVKGAAKEMGDTLNDNLGTRIEGWKRSAQIFVSDGLMSMIAGFESGESAGDGFKGAMSRVGVAIKNVTTWVMDNKQLVLTLVGAWAAWKLAVLAHAGAMKIVTAATKAWAVATKVAAVAMRVLNVVMKANPIGLIITAVTLLVGALVWFFTKTKVGKKIIEVAWNGIKAAIKGVSDWWTKTAWPAIKKVIVAFYVAFQLAKKKIGDAWEGIRKFVAEAPGKIKKAFGAGWQFLTDKLKEVIGSYGSGTGLMGRVRNVVEFYKGLGSRLSRAAGALWRFLTDKMKDALGSYSAGGGGVKGMLWNIVNFISSTLPNKIKSAAKSIWSGLIGNAMDVVGGVMKLVGKIPGVNGKITLNAAGVSKSYEYAQGGVLPGYTPGRDVHEFFSPTGGRLSLSGGEAIMRPEFTRAVGGAAGVAALNAKARKGEAFAEGGIWGMEKFKAPDALPGFIQTLVNATLGKLTVPSLLNAIGDKVFDYFLGGPEPRVIAPGGGKGGAGLSGNLSAMEAAAKALDPTARITSGYRPGAITATGYPSYHGMGRAIDIDSANKGALWDKLYLAYGKSSPELFFSGRSFSRFGNKGFPRSDHWDHVHWAMANGGILPKLYDQGGWIPNKGIALNMSGKPEAVLTAEESRGLKSGLSGEKHYHFHGITDAAGVVSALDRRERQARVRNNMYARG